MLNGHAASLRGRYFSREQKNNRPHLTGVRKTGLDRNYEMSICQAGLDNEKPLYSVKT